MKKKLLIMTAILVSSVACLNAQSFQKGTNVLSAGIGLGSSIGSFSNSTQMPGLSVNFERGVWEAGDEGIVSIGGYAGFKSFKYDYSSIGYSYTQKWNYTIIGVRSAYHYTGLNNDKLDVYGGVMLSYNLLSYKYEDDDPTDSYDYSGSFGSAAGFTGFVGGRYYFNPKIGAYAELGYGVSYLNAGISVKF